jgi:hypothetical protein
MSAFLDIPPPPDPLRRFVSASFRADVRSHQGICRVSTNEEGLLRVIQWIVARYLIDGHWDVLINRDDDLEDCEPAVCVRTAGGVVVTAGEGCIIAVDPERSVVYGFVASGVALSRFQDLMVNLLNATSRSELPAKDFGR